jgi:hypothetical protein
VAEYAALIVLTPAVRVRLLVITCTLARDGGIPLHMIVALSDAAGGWPAWFSEQQVVAAAALRRLPRRLGPPR